MSSNNLFEWKHVWMSLSCRFLYFFLFLLFFFQQEPTRLFLILNICINLNVNSSRLRLHILHLLLSFAKPYFSIKSIGKPSIACFSKQSCLSFFFHYIRQKLNMNIETFLNYWDHDHDLVKHKMKFATKLSLHESDMCGKCLLHRES